MLIIIIETIKTCASVRDAVIIVGSHFCFAKLSPTGMYRYFSENIEKSVDKEISVCYSCYGIDSKRHIVRNLKSIGGYDGRLIVEACP